MGLQNAATKSKRQEQLRVGAGSRLLDWTPCLMRKQHRDAVIPATLMSAVNASSVPPPMA